MSRFLALAVFVLVSCVVIEAQFGVFGKIKPGFVSPLIPSLDDIRLCKENANGRKFQMTYKLPTQTCQPYCKYDNETEQIMAEDGQFCCDFVGVGPTGEYFAKAINDQMWKALPEVARQELPVNPAAQIVSIFYGERLCKDGVCMVGGVAGWNRNGGFKTAMD